MNVQTTSSPSPRSSTPGPKRSTTPDISCPRTAGRGKAASPFITCRSVWHTPQARTLTRISPRFGSGLLNSSMVSGCPAPRRTAAFTSPSPLIDASPFLDYHLSVREQIYRLNLGMEGAEKRISHPSEREEGEGGGHPDVHPHVTREDPPPELSCVASDCRKDARRVAVIGALVDGFNRVVQTIGAHDAGYRTEDLALRHFHVHCDAVEDRGADVVP